LPPTWGARADVVVDFLGRPASLSWALATLDTGGRLVTLTTFPGVEFPLDPRRLVFGEGSVLGSRYATRPELDEAARLVATGRVRPVIGRREPVAGVDGIHEDLRAGRLLGRGALVWTGGG
ncbi:MAG: zinc-binding dehydrogenase, partial [bacterium]|nr:zinc-binding dehydrogenase [bacterium]